MHLKGKAAVDRRTKDLIKRIQPNQVAIIDHRDLDEVAACALVAARVKAVVNASPSITGRYPNPGPLRLAEAGIPLLDDLGSGIMEAIVEGEEVEVRDNTIYSRGQAVGQGILLDKESILQKMEDARGNYLRELEVFARNTLDYAGRELDLIIRGMELPTLRTQFRGRHALIVVRGHNYKEDLSAIRSYIEEVRPVLIGVDGGADALLENGFRPDLIIGDMDSITDIALRCGAELVVHAYPDGRAPGMQRIGELGLQGIVLPATGTSEDVGMLLAYEKGAELIVAVGTHSNMLDFLEKGRQGMASTLLVRMKVGQMLVDARGVSKLYRQRVKIGQLAGIVMAALIPLGVVLTVSPPTYQLARLLLLKLKLLFSI
ncbi:MAG: putative cytokinetic ring protein SteA [Bacillota bacterium]